MDDLSQTLKKIRPQVRKALKNHLRQGLQKYGNKPKNNDFELITLSIKTEIFGKYFEILLFS